MSAGFDPTQLFATIVNNINDIVIVTSADETGAAEPRIEYVNPAFTELTGYTSDEVLGKSPRILQGADTDPETRARIREALTRLEPVEAELLNYAKDGSPYWIDLKIIPLLDATGRVRHFASIERDISDRKRLQQKLERQATIDELTGLSNRRAFMKRAEDELLRAKRYGSPVSLIALDLDRFKRINDSLGHAVGDGVLKSFGQLCLSQIRNVDIAARVGGEEFSIVVPQTSLDGACLVADRIVAATRDFVLVLNGERIRFTVSAGVAELLPDEDLTALMARADGALYEAKNTGRDRVCTAATQLVESA